MVLSPSEQTDMCKHITFLVCHLRTLYSILDVIVQPLPPHGVL